MHFQQALYSIRFNGAFIRRSTNYVENKGNVLIKKHYHSFFRLKRSFSVSYLKHERKKLMKVFTLLNEIL